MDSDSSPDDSFQNIIIKNNMRNQLLLLLMCYVILYNEQARSDEECSDEESSSDEEEEEEEQVTNRNANNQREMVTGQDQMTIRALLAQPKENVNRQLFPPVTTIEWDHKEACTCIQCDDSIFLEEEEHMKKMSVTKKRKAEN